MDTEQKKEAARKRTAEWRKLHSRRTKIYANEWRKRSKRKIKGYHDARRESQPWYQCMMSAKQKCNNPKNPLYANFGAKGIKFLLSKADTAAVWERSNASQLKYPSLSRVDPSGDFTVENSVFKSMSEIASSRKARNQGMRDTKKFLGGYQGPSEEYSGSD